MLAHPAARLGNLLARPPMAWLGLRSYSFYLWHWPVLVLTPVVGIALPKGVLIPLQLVAVLALADLSYRFVELPFRGKAKLSALPDDWLRYGRPALFVAVPAVVLLVGWSGIAGSGSQRLQPGVAAASTAEFAQVRAKETGRRDPASQHGRGGASGPARAPRIVAIGDSVMVGAKEQLAARLGPGFSMNAKVGRQVDEAIALARQLKAGGHHPDDLILQIGNNGPLYSEEMGALRTATSEAGHVFLINDHAPVSWMGESNEKLAQAAKEWPRTSLIDWNAAARSRRGLTWDGIHLTPAGAGLYAQLVAGAVRTQARSEAAGH